MNELKQIAISGNFVFHGSAQADLTVLEPRQAVSSGRLDGKPCIAAAETIEPALFMAILGSRLVGGWGMGAPPRGHYGFYVNKKDYEKAKTENWTGCVYVLPKEEFQPYMAWEWRAYHPVKPVKVFKLQFEDLPEEITLEE